MPVQPRLHAVVEATVELTTPPPTPAAVTSTYAAPPGRVRVR